MAVDLGLFELITEEKQDKRPVTAKGLAAQTDAEHLLIGIKNRAGYHDQSEAKGRGRLLDSLET